jgi:hypothetical protein
MPGDLSEDAWQLVDLVCDRDFAATVPVEILTDVRERLRALLGLWRRMAGDRKWLLEGTSPDRDLTAC